MEHAVDDVSWRTMTNFQSFNHFIDCYQPTFPYHLLHFNVNVKRICSVTLHQLYLITNFKLLMSLLYQPKCHTRVLMSPLNSVMNIFRFFILTVQETDKSALLFLSCACFQANCHLESALLMSYFQNVPRAYVSTFEGIP